MPHFLTVCNQKIKVNNIMHSLIQGQLKVIYKYIKIKTLYHCCYPWSEKGQ